ncbi:MAG: tRNA-dihydrouridine synthase family protein [Anaerolineales bacterium]|nr:tRNA-dihydrouridine synthase family protein [Anaerolineales bacterium]
MDNTLSPTFYVGPVPVYGDKILAPMDGVSDWPFRSLCRELGSAMSYTEFIRAEYVLRRPEYVNHKLMFRPDERPVVFQIYGEDPDKIVKACLRLQELGPDLIDVNMGCPARSVANRGAGVGLMRTPKKAARVFQRLTAVLDVPVSGKIRLGWEDCRNYELIARIIEENGGQLIAVHARTKEQRYGGQANWDAVAEVKQAVRIPVIGNGDVRTIADVKRMKAHTGCEAVMIGRGAIDNPWIFSGLDREQVPARQVRALLRQHLERNVQFYGEDNGTRLFRKYAVQYLQLKSLTREERRKLLSKHPPEEFLALLDQVYTAMDFSKSVMTHRKG